MVEFILRNNYDVSENEIINVESVKVFHRCTKKINYGLKGIYELVKIANDIEKFRAKAEKFVKIGR